MAASSRSMVAFRSSALQAAEWQWLALRSSLPFGRLDSLHGPPPVPVYAQTGAD